MGCGNSGLVGKHAGSSSHDTTGPLPPATGGETRCITLPPIDRPTAAQIIERRQSVERGEYKYDAFLSHKQKDTAMFARLLKESLQHKYHYELFLDKDAADNLSDLMPEVRASRTLIFILSNNIFQSEWCMRELREALLWEIPIILVTAEGSSWDQHVFPLDNFIPTEVKPAFRNLALAYHADSHASFLQEKLVPKLGKSKNQRGLDSVKLQAEAAASASSSQSSPLPTQAAVESASSSAHVASASATVTSKPAQIQPRPTIPHQNSILHASPEEDPLIKGKLDDPLKKLNLDESIAVLTQCVRYGRRQALKAANRHILLFIGNTGAGKSTLANYLAGCTMEARSPKSVGLKSLEDVIVVKPPGEGGSLAEIMPIGHTKVSKTFMPHIETAPESATADLTFCDCPGFLDSRGSEINIANAVNIRSAIADSASVRVVVLINYHSLMADRGRGLSEMLKICSDLFGNSDTLLRHRDSILIGISNAPEKLRLPNLREFMEADAPSVMQQLAERVFAFTPLEKDLPRLPEGWWGRADLLRAVQELKPITAHRKIFSTVLTDEDETMLMRLSEKLGERITTAMSTREYSQAASVLAYLFELRVIDHLAVERLTNDNVRLIERSLSDLAQAFRSHCTFEQFSDAEAALRDISVATSSFSIFDGLSSSVDLKELQQYLDKCRAKLQETEARETAMQAQLQAAEDRAQEFLRLLEEQRAATEAKLAEQSRAHELLLQQLQEQIARTTADYDRMKETLQHEFESQLARKVDEAKLQTGQSQEEVKRKLEEERARLQAEYDEKLLKANQQRDAILHQQKQAQADATTQQAEREKMLQVQLKQLQEKKEKRQREVVSPQDAAQILSNWDPQKDGYGSDNKVLPGMTGSVAFGHCMIFGDPSIPKSQYSTREKDTDYNQTYYVGLLYEGDRVEVLPRPSTNKDKKLRTADMDPRTNVFVRVLSAAHGFTKCHVWMLLDGLKIDALWFEVNV